VDNLRDDASPERIALVNKAARQFCEALGRVFEPIEGTRPESATRRMVSAGRIEQRPARSHAKVVTFAFASGQRLTVEGPASSTCSPMGLACMTDIQPGLTIW
jgi:hypothetical protein